MAEGYKTVMYSVGEKGEVLVHRFPWDANKREGMQKLQKLVKRGFTFNDPRKGGGSGIPEVIVTKEVDVSKPETGEEIEVSDESVSFVTPESDIKQEDIAREEVDTSLILCPECGKGCKSFWGLETHMKKHLRERGELEPAKKRGKYKKKRK